MGLAVGVAIVVGLLALGFAAGDVLLLLFVAILLGSALEPMVGSIRDHLPLGRGATILVVYVGFFVTVLGLGLRRGPRRDRAGPAHRRRACPPSSISARAWAATLRPAALSSSVSALIDSAASTLKPPSGPPNPDQVVEVGAAAVEAAVTVATLLTLVFFWLVEHARLQRYLLAYLPAGAARRRPRRLERDRDAARAVGPRPADPDGRDGRGDRASPTPCSGLPGALLLGLIAALTEAIPIVGPLLGRDPGRARRGHRVTRSWR